VRTTELANESAGRFAHRRRIEVEFIGLGRWKLPVLTCPQIGGFQLSTEDAITSRIAINTRELAIIWPYQTFTATIIVPFDTWQPTGSKNPPWFDAYNGIKHEGY
jgi:hypothetical protein